MLNTISTLAHHGIIYVPLGYASAFAQLTNLTEVHGGMSISFCRYILKLTATTKGSPWGAGTLASSDGSRQPSKLELEIAGIQGGSFYETLAKINF